jgi:membrane protease YdiL (CAAX protease family)
MAMIAFIAVPGQPLAMETAAEKGTPHGVTSKSMWKPAVGLLIALALPLVPLGKWIAPGEKISDLLTHEAVWWAYAAIVLAWLLLVEKRNLTSIGFRMPTWRTFVFALLAGIVLTAIIIVHFALIVPALHLDAGVAGKVREQIMQRPYWYRVLMVSRAAVVEEILFRAYLMEKVRELTGSRLAAIALSVIAFTYAHLSGWGVVHLIPVFGAAVIFALLYVWRRDTPSNMIAHFITDGMGFLLA